MWRNITGSVQDIFFSVKYCNIPVQVFVRAPNDHRDHCLAGRRRGGGDIPTFTTSRPKTPLNESARNNGCFIHKSERYTSCAITVLRGGDGGDGVVVEVK